MPLTEKSPKLQSATLKAVDELKNLIFSGELSADSNHLESELATRLGMSRTPVREATLVLEVQGLLEVRPRKGVRIKSVSADDMAEIYDVLTELESLAAKRAAQSGFTKKELKQLASSIEQMDKAIDRENREAWAQADDAFHVELVRLGGNQRIQDIVTVFNDQVRRARNVTLHIRPLPTQSNHDHRRVYQAILDGDGKAAQRIHCRHRRETRKLLVSLLNQPGLKRV